MTDIKDVVEKLQKATEVLRNAETEKKIAESKLNDVTKEIEKIRKECIETTGNAPEQLTDVIKDKMDSLNEIVQRIGEINFSEDDTVMFSEDNLKKIEKIYEDYHDMMELESEEE